MPAKFVCIQCRYDLAATDLAGRCPECGAPVAETVVGNDIGFRRWVRTVRLGALLVVLPELTVLFVLFMPMFVPTHGRWMYSNSQLLMSLYVVTMVGWFLATVRSPTEGERVPSRRLAVAARTMSAIASLVLVPILSLTQWSDCVAGSTWDWLILLLRRAYDSQFRLTAVAFALVLASYAVGALFLGELADRPSMQRLRWICLFAAITNALSVVIVGATVVGSNVLLPPWSTDAVQSPAGCFVLISRVAFVGVLAWFMYRFSTRRAVRGLTRFERAKSVVH